ncbi:MAG: transcription termination/antitermination protein NusA [Oligosphaeraceae bacterium]|nr:transcription termination/antitermination protein NusA [Oligosphaeraceae bacterium]
MSDKSNLLAALDYLEHERGIDRETLIELIAESLRSAARKAIRQTRELVVKFDEKDALFRCWAKLFVAEKVEDPGSEIELEKARQKFPGVAIGDEIEWEVTPKNFGRIAAQAARQVISQGLRQAEKRNICELYRDQLNQLLNGVVKQIDRNEIIIDFGQAEGAMRFQDKIPGEEYHRGDHLTALLIEINDSHSGPSLYVSRNHPDFVVKLFEREVSEISEGLVEIKAIAREAGYRSKIAVHANEARVDPVGACVGMRGNRVKTIVRELNGEKIDIVEWSADIRKFVENALKPAKLSNVTVEEASKTVRIKVAEDQLSLSIGRKGQNARLASKLVGWRIDISKIETEPEESAQDDYETLYQQAVDRVAQTTGIEPDKAEILVQNGFNSLEVIVTVNQTDIAKLEGIGEELAEHIIKAAKEHVQN